MNKRDLSVIDRIIVHQSQSDVPAHDNISVIEDWHKERFEPTPDGVHVAYHRFIQRDGNTQKGRDLKWYGQHTKGQNWTSVGICLHGHMKDYTQEQYQALIAEIIILKSEIPSIKYVFQHSDFDKSIDKVNCAGLKEDTMEYLQSFLN